MTDDRPRKKKWGVMNHDGRACARPSRFQRCYPQLKTEIKSITWCDAGSGLSTQTDPVLAILTLGEPNLSIWERG